MSTHITRRLGLGAAAVVGTAALLLAGCSGSGGATPSGGSGGSPAADLDAATEFLAPYQAEQKSLVLDEPLASPLPKGLNIAFLDVGTPVAGVMWDLLQPLIPLTGITLTRENIGSTPEEQDAAMATVVQKGYDGIINVTAEPGFYPNQVTKLLEAGIPMASASVMHTEEYKLPIAFNGPDFMREAGRAQAAAAVVRTEGKATHFVYYPVNEFEFTGFQAEGFVDEMAELCPGCEVRQVGIPIQDVINQDPTRIVNDLQANPQTEYFVAAADEMTSGLPQKLDVAGITVKGSGTWSIPPDIQNVADGKADSTFAEDFALFMWTVTDQLFREITDTPYEWPDPSVSAPALMRLLTQEDAGDYLGGYVAVPDYQEQYAKLWGVS